MAALPNVPGETQRPSLLPPLSQARRPASGPFLRLPLCFRFSLRSPLFPYSIQDPSRECILIYCFFTNQGPFWGLYYNTTHLPRPLYALIQHFWPEPCSPNACVDPHLDPGGNQCQVPNIPAVQYSRLMKALPLGPYGQVGLCEELAYKPWAEVKWVSSRGWFNGLLKTSQNCLSSDTDRGPGMSTWGGAPSQSSRR